jgi:hypothetical protein
MTILDLLDVNVTETNSVTWMSNFKASPARVDGA